MPFRYGFFFLILLCSCRTTPSQKSFWPLLRYCSHEGSLRYHNIPSKHLQASLSFQLIHDLAYQFIIKFEIFLDLGGVRFASLREVSNNLFFGGLVVNIAVFYDLDSRQFVPDSIPHRVRCV